EQSLRQQRSKNVAAVIGFSDPKKEGAMRFGRPAVFAVIVLSSFSAWAAQRTFVSGSGNDANPCTRDMPCRSFGAAIAVTSTNGEVVALDSAGYGPVTVTQGVATVAPNGVHAGISVVSGAGVA